MQNLCFSSAQNSGMMFRPHYVSLPEAAPAPPALDDNPKPEIDPSLTDTTKESTRQVTTTTNTITPSSSATPVTTTGVGGAMGGVSQQPIGSSNMNPPQVSGPIRPPPSTSIPSQQGAHQGQFTLNPGMHRAPNTMMMRTGQGAVGRGMMGGAGGGATAGGMQPQMSRMMSQQVAGGGMTGIAARMKLEQIRAQHLMHVQQQQQQIRAGGGVQYPGGAAGPMMANHPPPNYRTPMMNPAAAGGMPPGAPEGMMATHDMTQQMLLRHQQVQQRRNQMARLQQMHMQRRAAAMQQMAAGGYPAGAAHGQQYTMRPGPGPMQATPPMPMGQMMQAPQQAQYVQQPPGGPGVMMPPGGPRPPAQAPMGYQPAMNPGQPPMYR